MRDRVRTPARVHVTIADTTDTYRHVTPSRDADATNLATASIFSGGKAAKRG